MHRAWMSPVNISVIGAEGRHLELKAVLQDDNYPKMRTDRVRARKKRLHSFRARVSSDVIILRRQSTHHVAYATACEVRDVPLLTQSRRYFPCGVFHGRSFHRTTITASPWKSGSLPNVFCTLSFGAYDFLLPK